MILSAYRNPPYRSPTPKHKPDNNNHTPQQQQPAFPNQQEPATSPHKRKRSNSTESLPTIPSTPSPPRIDTVSRVQDEEVITESGANSPRSKVAEKFSNLRLAREESPKKKLKRQPATKWTATPEKKAFVLLEVAETPQPQSSSGDPDPDTATALATPLPPDEDQAALTWQDDEITGHLIDTSTPDDDGEGINGIGFKPTTAMAYARSQKRKQQVSEWKAREAREARQRRLERRKGGSSEADGEGKEGGRVVRFLDGK